MPLTKDEIENRFGFHKGTIEGPNATVPRHAELRREFCRFAKLLNEVLPDGRSKSVAFIELENASMWAHKSIAEKAPVDTTELYEVPSTDDVAPQYQ